jgi:hypothetical protein
MRYTAVGVVTPERAEVSFSYELSSPDSTWYAVVSAEASQLSVVFDRPDVMDLVHAYQLASEYAVLAVCSHGFSLGSGYGYEIRQVIGADGVPHVFGVRPVDQEGNTLGFDHESDSYMRALRLAVIDPHFARALRDYTQAIPDFIDCAFYCYRAVESLKATFSEEGPNQWASMRTSLSITRDVIDRVKKFADPIRHGDWNCSPVTTPMDRWEILSTTKTILASYMVFRETQAIGSVVQETA